MEVEGTLGLVQCSLPLTHSAYPHVSKAPAPNAFLHPNKESLTLGGQERLYMRVGLSEKEVLVSYQDGALFAMVSMELHHGLEGEITDHITVENEERVCSLRE